MGWSYSHTITITGTREEVKKAVKGWINHAGFDYNIKVFDKEHSFRNYTAIINGYSHKAYDLEAYIDNVIPRAKVKSIITWSYVDGYGHEIYENGKMLENKEAFVPAYELPVIDEDTHIWRYWTPEEEEKIWEDYNKRME